MKLRVWHVSNVPGELFRQNVASISEAKLVLNTLARHDLYLGDLIESNAQGLEVFEDGEWVEWSDAETGEDIRAVIRQEGSFEPVTSRQRQSPEFTALTLAEQDMLVDTVIAAARSGEKLHPMPTEGMTVQSKDFEIAQAYGMAVFLAGVVEDQRRGAKR